MSGLAHPGRVPSEVDDGYHGVDRDYQQGKSGRGERVAVPMTRKQLGELIRQARMAKGLTLRAAASQVNIDKGYYSRIESGQIALGKHARAVAELYDLDPDELEVWASKLPSFRLYLRAKYDLPPEAIAQLEAEFEAVSEQFKKNGGQS